MVSTTDLTVEVNQLESNLKIWLEDPKHFFVGQFAIEHGLSRDELDEVANNSPRFSRALKYAYAVQEYRVAMGALDGSIDRTVALKMLDTFHDWKSDTGSNATINMFQKYANDASLRAGELDIE